MKKCLFISVFLIGFSIKPYAQKILPQKEQEITICSFDSVQLSGTLLMPRKHKRVPLVIFIAGSGPTDRDGNQNTLKNNALKLLSKALQKKSIASFRYDKRGVGKSLMSNMDESLLRFEHFVNDACAIIHFFKQQKQFSSITILGHSEGALIGLLAAQQEQPDAYISLAGVGRSADQLLLEQLEAQRLHPKPILDSLKQGHLVKNTHKFKQLFRPSVQPYLISWFQYNPKEEIAELKIPVLIVQGTNDIQVQAKEAKILKSANPNAQIVMVDNMNHILKIIKGDYTENLKSYYNPTLPISKSLIRHCSLFIKDKVATK